MPSGTTPNIGLTLPTIGGDNAQWGNELNQNLQLIDAAFSNVGGAGLVQIPVNSATINVTPTQAKASIIRLIPGSFGSGFTVIMPAGPKNPFIIQNATGAAPTIKSVANANHFTIQPSQSAFFYQDEGDIAIYGLSATVGGVALSGQNLDFESNTIIGQTDSGGGSVTLVKAGGTGGNLVDFPALTGSTSASIRNKTLLIYVPSGMTRAWAGFPVLGIGLRIAVKTGVLTIGHARIFNTTELDMHVQGRTGLMAWSGVNTNIVFDATGGILLATSDNLTLAGVDLSNGGDFYIAIYFADVAGNDTVTVGQATGGVNVPEALVAGDLVNTNVGSLLNGGTPVTSYATHTLVMWLEDTGI